MPIRDSRLIDARNLVQIAEHLMRDLPENPLDRHFHEARAILAARQASELLEDLKAEMDSPPANEPGTASPLSLLHGRARLRAF
jgi:hypothetical protein